MMLRIKNMFLKRLCSRYYLNSRRVYWLKTAPWLIGLSMFVLVVDSYDLQRVARFENEAHASEHAAGILWVETTPKHGDILLLNTPERSIQLSCSAPGLGGSHSCVPKEMYTQGQPADVRWMLVPDGIFSGEARFPVEITQKDKLIFSSDIHQISNMQRYVIKGEILIALIILLFGCFMLAFSIFKRSAQ